MPDRYASYDELSRVSSAVKELAAEQVRTRQDIAQIRSSVERTADSIEHIEKSTSEMRGWLEGSTLADGTPVPGLLDQIALMVRWRVWLKSTVITIAVGAAGTFAVASIRLIVDLFGPSLLKHQ